MSPQSPCKLAFCWRGSCVPKPCRKQEALLVRGQSSPVIHQGVTVQLLVPIPCPGQFLLCISVPATPAVKCLDYGYHTSGGGGARLCLGQVFIVQSGFRNVECYNLGRRMVGNWAGNLVSGSCAFLALCLQRLPVLLGSPLPLPALAQLAYCLPPRSLRVPDPDLGGTVSFG